MIQADLHVHSKASRKPSEWYLKKTGASESYTDIEALYRHAKDQGMDFVTVTDHNTIEGALELTAGHPEDTFISVEVSAFFPEDRCEVHILVYDITPEQFARIDMIRHNIYQLRDYFKKNDIAYSVAHGFYSVNGKLRAEHLEKLIVLFDVFEGCNGSRNFYFNETWRHLLKDLTKKKIEALAAKHKLKPYSSDPWIKGFTGGSDDHAGMFIGQTHTVCSTAFTKEQFIRSIKNKETGSAGRCHDFKSFAFSIFKIFCDYYSSSGKESPGGLLSFINNAVFEENHPTRLRKWAVLRRMKKSRQEKDRIILKFLEDVYNWSDDRNMDMEARLENIYNSMGLLLDEFFKMLIRSASRDFYKGDIGRLFNNMMSALPAFLISIPFFSSLKHLSRDRDVMIRLKRKMGDHHGRVNKKVMWFSDTMSDLNGVCVTLNKFRRQIVQRKLDVKFVTCTDSKGAGMKEDAGIMYLPGIYSITPKFYSSYTLNFPSLLTSIEMISRFRPDRIVISTPGPVGILGMIMAGILGVDCVTIYHTDFAAQADHIFDDPAISGLIRSFTNKFYSFSTQIKVPTEEYIHILEDQGYDKKRMSIFKRGFTVKDFNPSSSWKKTFFTQKKIQKGTTLMWAGRVSKDKNIDFLIDVYKEARKQIPDLNLVICGNGPDLAYYKEICRPHNRIHFKGRVKNDQLQQYYEASDIFVFPSTTDTFGMVILEAQAKGLYCLVSDIGGPQEIVKDGEWGEVLGLSDLFGWVDAITRVYNMKREYPNEFAGQRSACQERIRNRYDWDEALNDILDTPTEKIPPNVRRINGAPLKKSEPVYTVERHRGVA